MIKDIEEMDVFKSSSLINLIDFKWETTGQGHHLYGFIIHMLYMGTLVYYTYDIYYWDNLGYLKSYKIINGGKDKDGKM